MEHAVIPAPVRADATDGGEFAFRPGTVVAYSDPRITTLAERFCARLARQTGLRPHPVQEDAAAKPFVLIDLIAGADPDGLPASAGLSPAGGDPADERYSLLIDTDRVIVRAAEPAGAARGLTTLIQLAATAPDAGQGEIRLPAARILDGPRYAWRGLSLDVARTFFTVEEIRRVIDLLELYKLNVLHLHLTDDQAWRLPMGRPPGGPDSGEPFYRLEDLRALAAYAADRFVTVVPEVDTPGHATALLRLHPELATGRNEVDYEILPGHPRHATWLDPELPATFGMMEQVLAGLAAIFPGPYLHIGADEPRGMPDDLYVAYVQRLRRLIRALGRRPLGWQESARAGLRPDDVIQFWLTGIELPPDVPPRVRAQVEAELALADRDVEAVVAASVPVIVSPLPSCYLDVPYAEPSADPAQGDRRDRLGLRVYAPRSVAASFGWEPAEALGPGRAAQVAGVEAAIWAETITGFDDLCFLLLPRLAGVAHRAWSPPPPASQPDGWPAHRGRLARHGRLWTADGLEYFRSSAVDWA
ncbi:MAG TPA: family 20 glycosylhydrolase [Streptosporangiaceae bacterium]|nr:family 20 glycosylhydrolase [Streptosporangiaceae bacterium]